MESKLIGRARAFPLVDSINSVKIIDRTIMSNVSFRAPYFSSFFALCGAALLLAGAACSPAAEPVGSGGAVNASGSTGNATGGANGGTTNTGGGGVVVGGGTGGGGFVFNFESCGDGVKSADEECDDGNEVGADGCSIGCQIETDFECPVPGEPCVSTAVCPNGVLSSTEQCDDGNAESGDGCAADCGAVEPGWQCRLAGRPCVPLCGDSVIIGGENCDDGNNVSGDGCSSTCLTEPGWSCDGTTCVQSVCGNGVTEAGETCDLGDQNGLFLGDGMGCSKTCTKEPLCRDAGGGPTRACDAICGNGNIDDGEGCDDGNLVDADGCSSTCTLEGGFDCPAAEQPDTVDCPDGGGECLILPIIYRDFDSDHPDFYFLGDDGVNCVPNASGNKDTTDPNECWDGDSTDLCQGLAAATLGDDGKPVLGTGTTCECRFTDWDSDLLPNTGAGIDNCQSGDANPNRIETVVDIADSPASFLDWYHDSASSTTVIDTLVLEANGGGTYQFDSGDTIADNIADGDDLTAGHFPLDGQTGIGGDQLCNMWPYWDNGDFLPGCSGEQWNPDANDGEGGMEEYDGREHNFYFTSEVRYLFKYVGGESLEFFGDDDVFVYINGQLTLDLGAPHERLRGDVVLNDGSAVATVYQADGDESVTTVPMTLEVGKIYEIAIFHADRHPRESNYQLTLQGFSTTRSECVPSCGDNVATTGEECDEGEANSDSAYGGCTTECRFGPFCGDGVVDEGFEECDAGRENTGLYGEIGACASGCTPARYCGDGLLDSAFGEECDAGPDNGAGACLIDCKFDVR